MTGPRPGGDQGPGPLPGLSSEQAASRLSAIGPNSLPPARRTPWWHRVVAQLRSSIIYILLFALGFDLFVWFNEGAVGWPYESIAIAVILIFNAAMGVWQEYRAEDALARLEELAAPRVFVVRDGVLVQIDATGLVPGDAVRVEAGDRIPADGEIEPLGQVTVDESILTGESLPVDRRGGEVVSAGTLAVRGHTWFTITATGPASTMGRIAELLSGVDTQPTPLERRLEQFGHQVAIWIAALAVALAAGGIATQGITWFDEALLFAVAVAVAAVPEGLPAVLTLTLALGTERMSDRKAVVRRLAAVEALGSVTVIATDKTGTLTENVMTVDHLDSPDPDRAMTAMVLASDAEPSAEVGDPLELGLYRFAADHGVDAGDLRARHHRVGARPFDSGSRFMSVTVMQESGPVTYLKGAAEVLLDRADLSDAERAIWHDRINAAAADGYRVLGLAWAAGQGESDVTWLGTVSMWDPPRAEVPAAIAVAQEAGIRVLMVTGDHPATARAIAERLGIPSETVVSGTDLDRMSATDLADSVADVSVFARVSPEHKLALVGALREQGEIVAMTGDGVNDAPALKRSDVGVAMGQRGSDVSREVADLVLIDDNFATIGAAVEEGRGIFDNIQKFLRFLFSTNVALVLLVSIGVLGSTVLGLFDAEGNILVPLTAVQLLWINLIADGPPALALGLDRNPGVMRRPPRAPTAPLLTRAGIRFVVTTGVLKAAVGLSLFFFMPSLDFTGEETRTAVFLYESLAQLAFVYPSRRISERPVRNRVLNWIIVASIALQALTISSPWLRTILGLEQLDAEALGLVAMSLAASIIGANLSTRSTREYP